MEYTKKELLNIYNNSILNKLSNPELSNFKNQLHLVCSNANFEAIDLEILIFLLNNLNSEKVVMIDEEFINFSIEITKNKLLRFFYPFNDIIELVFNDYKKYSDLNTLSYKLIWFNFLNEHSIEVLKKYNSDLANIFSISQQYLKKRYDYEKEGLRFPISITNEIFERTIILLLANIEIYNYDYSLPSKVATYILNNQEKFEKLLSYFYITLITKDYKLLDKKNIFIKILLNYFSKQNKVVSLEELKLKKKLNNRNFNLSSLFKS